MNEMRRFAMNLNQAEGNASGTDAGNEDDSLAKLLKQPSMPNFPPTWLVESYPEKRGQFAGSSGSKPVEQSRYLAGTSGQSGGYGGAKAQPNYDDEARKLWARLNMDPKQENNSRYNPLDVIWCHPETKAKIYIGNEQAAKNLALLQQHNITHVINCTDSIPLFHDKQPGAGITYLRFDICRHHMVENDEQAMKFAMPMLTFVSDALRRGENVMAHCLAGAHRAGTTGIICLMHFAKLDVKTAKCMAKRCRPIIDPIGNFPMLLVKLERAMNR